MVRDEGTLGIQKNGSGVFIFEIEQELKRVVGQQQNELILLDKVDHWQDKKPQEFTRNQRDATTILYGGLTLTHDGFIEAALSAQGYNLKHLDCPDSASLTEGKEFCNRGQCNPTYYTVGNLIKYLHDLRDNQGMSTETIIDNYLFVSPGTCGPCRFGMYVTEYRKALRDAGFEGFRVLSFQSSGGLNQSGDALGLALTPRFFIALVKCFITADVINAIGYRLRPYEKISGDTDKALEKCRQVIGLALRKKQNILLALNRCRKILSKVPIDRLIAKPKVSIIGEFWAMTTEGDGNYRLQRFLEDEGAECDTQLVTNWLLYLLWDARHKVQQSMLLAPDKSMGGKGVIFREPIKKLLTLWFANKVLKAWFYLYARITGLNGYVLPDMGELAEISHPYYYNELRGGEGHLEVGKLIQSVEKRKAHLVISVKPFGCMPSSGVSDGVQSLITTLYPKANFLAIETTGDGAVNVYSRIQMALYKARQTATEEYKQALESMDMNHDKAKIKMTRLRKYSNALKYAKHHVACTAANFIYAA